MRKMLVAALVGGLLWLSAGLVGPVVTAGDNGPDGNGSLPVILMAGDNGPDGYG